jgi:hypothetical protein
MTRIKYLDSTQTEVIEEINDSDLLRRTGELYNIYNSMIWVEMNGEFVLAGISP